MLDLEPRALFAECWSALCVEPRAADYALVAEYAGSYVAWSRAGNPCLLLPIVDGSSAMTGRRAAGCELLAHRSTRFAHGGQEWEAPAAALVCSDIAVLDAFVVLAADVVQRCSGNYHWASILEAVEEWQTLLAPRGRPSAEAELGLWGELWFIDGAVEVERLLAGWRGPERDSTDFFVDGVAVDVKTTRVRRRHRVSQSQVEMPVGTHPAWFASLWVKMDPAARTTVPALVDSILARTTDRGDGLRRICRAGYSPNNRREYAAGFVLLSEPEWFAVGDVPRVRMADPGVSDLRYAVTLDGVDHASPTEANRLWMHFHGCSFGAER